MDDMISVIVPVYNVAEYLRMCLDSLLQQTHQKMEIIIVDDGSTDSSGRICDEYAERYPNRVVVVHTLNHGLSAARNVGIRVANGGYIGFVDSDDWVEPEMFQTLYTNMIQYNADISSCGVINDFNNGVDKLNKVSDKNIYNQNELFGEIITNKNVYGYVCNKLFRKSMLQTIRFDEGLTSCEDFDFTVHYAEQCRCGVSTPSELYHYRQRLGSMTGEFQYNPRKLSIIKAYEQVILIYSRVCPEYLYILQRNYLKININVLGRMRVSHFKDTKIEKMLSENICSNYSQVMKDIRNSKATRVNIWLSCRFPAGMLRLKQLLLKRRYKG